MDGQTNKNSIVIPVVIAIIITAVVVGAGVYWWQQRLIDETHEVFQDLQQQVEGLSDKVGIPTIIKGEDEVTEVAEPAGWKSYFNEELGFLMQYPEGHLISAGNKFFQIMPEPTAEVETPLAVMDFRFYESQMNAEDLLAKDITPLEVTDVTINGLSGKKYVVRYPDMPEDARCTEYILGNENMTVAMNQYECLEWEYFEDAVNRFYLIYK